MSEITALPPAAAATLDAAAPEAGAGRESADWRRIYTTPEGRAAIAVFVGLCLAFARIFEVSSGAGWSLKVSTATDRSFR